MGLDMYIFTSKTGPPDSESDEEIAYWRKHPDLHGWIVRHLTPGRDDCEPIPLVPAVVDALIEAVKKEELTKTSGFFFGASESADQDDTLKKLSRVRKIMTDEPNTLVYYQASW